jgi:hypothetical protein
MAMYIFRGHDDRRAARRALDFWYRRMKDQISLMDFLRCCRRGCAKDAQGELISFVVYRGPAPPPERSAQARMNAKKAKK